MTSRTRHGLKFIGTLIVS